MATPIILCDCAGMSEKRWLECREHGPKGDIEYTVGGSDVATIFGLSPWMTPKELWMIKKGRMKPKDKLRQIINENKDADFVLWNGNRVQIKRKLFEKFIDQSSCI